MSPAFRVYLVRHGSAEGTAASDAARRLTAEGRARFAALARALGPRLTVTRILSSPLVRARETADLLAAATGAPVEEEGALASGASTGRELLALASRLGAGVAIVGHNPEVAEAIAIAAEAGVEVRPGTIAAIDVAPGRYALAWSEQP